MDQVFKHLIQRATPQPIIKIGTPWQCIPIKNDKQARDTTEIHLANQGINELQGFDKFMNLEVVWLNGNQLQSLKGIEGNFRIKHLFLQKNRINDLSGLLQLKHLETLSLFGNELRNLDNNLEILIQFPSLRQLDLFENPLAEEPHYRNRVIQGIPQLELLDRHMITVQEKIKVAKWYQDYRDPKIKKKGLKKKAPLPSQVYSKCERILFSEATNIKQQQKEKEKLEYELERTRIKEKEKTFDPNKLPVNEVREQLRKRREEDPMSVVTEWEKGRFKKLFKQYDPQKKGSIAQDKLELLYKDLMNDVANIGKVPKFTFPEFQAQMPQDPLPWDTFGFALNHVIFTRAPEEALDQKIAEKYKELNRKLNAGKKQEAKEYVFDLMRLEGARDATENKHPQLTVKDTTVVRNDTFNFARYAHRNTFNDSNKYLL